MAKKRTITVDPATGRLMLDGQVLDRADPRMWGSVGRNVLQNQGMDLAATGNVSASNFDPRYYEQVEEGGNDGGPVTGYRLRPEIAERLGGRNQLSQSGVGGYNEAIDPSRLEWDDEFGILTPQDNIGAQDTRRSDLMGALAMAAFGAPSIMAGGADLLGQLGLGGGAGGGVNPGLDAFEAGLGGEWGGGVTGQAASPALAGTPAAGVGGAGGVGPMAEMGAGGAAPSGLSGLGSRLSNAITSDPLGALRTAGGLASLGAGVASSRNGGGDNAVGSLDDLLDRQANANRYDWNTTTGSRSWEQGPDGRWTVNDRLNPEEQANYENVRTLNSGSTDYARQLLARTMANPQRDYYGSLPTSDSYFGRWRG